MTSDADEKKAGFWAALSLERGMGESTSCIEISADDWLTWTSGMLDAMGMFRLTAEGKLRLGEREKMAGAACGF